MLRKYFLFPLVIAVGIMCVATNDARAQFWGRGWNNYYPWGSWGTAPGYYNYNSTPGSSYQTVYYYYPLTSGYYPPNAVPTHSYSYYPSTSYNSPARYTSGTNDNYQPGPASVKVTVREPNAKLWFNDVLTKQTGINREFQSPTINGRATYHVKAQWQENGKTITEEKDVTVAPNEKTVIYFNNEGP